MEEKANMAQRYEREIPEGYEARIEGNKVIIEKKEDVDERIRESIVDFIWRIANGAFNRGSMPSAVQCQEWLSYLEKQKEQKLYTYEQSKQAAEDCYYDKGYNTEDGGRCNQQSFLWGFEEGVNWCEQHKEQKPVEWDEEDKKRLDWIIEYFRQGGSLYDDLIHWLEQLPERFNLQPKQEWSEEDEERYNSCLQRLGTGNPDQPETINSKWFKEHVTSQPHWKPSKENRWRH